MMLEKNGQNFETPLLEKEKHLKDLRDMRYERIEKLPLEDLSHDKNRKLYKCRNNFFTSVYLKILVLQQKGFVNSPEAKQGCDDFFKFYKTIVKNLEFYKREAIDEANKVLDCLIKELS